VIRGGAGGGAWTEVHAAEGEDGLPAPRRAHFLYICPDTQKQLERYEDQYGDVQAQPFESVEQLEAVLMRVTAPAQASTTPSIVGTGPGNAGAGAGSVPNPVKDSVGPPAERCAHLQYAGARDAPIPVLHVDDLCGWASGELCEVMCDAWTLFRDTERSDTFVSQTSFPLL
jgi:hypothetical protein